MHVDRGIFFFCFGARLYQELELDVFFFFWLLMYLFFFLDVFIIYGLYMLRGDTMFFISFIVSCFTYATLVIDLYYEVIHGIRLLFFYFVKSRTLFCFTCIFHTCVYVFVECFSNIQVYSVVLLSTLVTDRQQLG